MKFTNGYWHIKPEMDPHFATQYLESQTIPDKAGNLSLNVLAATKAIRGRGDTLNSPTLDVTFSSPRENIIRVKIAHFTGVQEKGPFFETFEETVSPEIHETPSFISYQNGALEVRVSKEEGRWQVDFYGDGKLLTTSGYHGMAHILKKTAITGSIMPPGDPYMTESLMLDVGENIYGLGERFTPYIKNGQEVTMWNADGGTASELAYKNIPFYMTNRGYGIFVEDSSDVSFEVASEKVERVQFSVSGESLTYDIIYGWTPKGILELYTALTGRPALPPAWSFGLWLSTSFTTDYDD